MARKDDDDDKTGKLNSLLPAVRPKEDKSTIAPSVIDPIQIYLRDISRIPMLPEEETQKLAERLFYEGDIQAAKRLVQANLRLVVKIAMEYRGMYPNPMDLIQEGNLGLMKAVSKYDPRKNVKLSYYASWWIKSYILKYVLDNFNLVRISSGKTQKKLFYNLLKEQNKLNLLGVGGTNQSSTQLIAQNLGVSEKKVEQMSTRLQKGNEFSLTPEEGEAEFVVVDSTASADELLEQQEENRLLENAISQASFTPNEQVLFDERVMSDSPKTLQEVADILKISRERARQLEAQVLKKLKKAVDKNLESSTKSYIRQNEEGQKENNSPSKKPVKKKKKMSTTSPSSPGSKLKKSTATKSKAKKT